MNKLTDCFALNNGEKIPCIGFGTWQTPDGQTAIDSVVTAVKAGYRHIDTAAAYKNEDGVGEGIKKSGIKREDIFVTSKLWNTERGYDKTIAAFDKSLSDLGLDYLDLYLIHWPANSVQFKNWEEINSDTWRAFEKLHRDGKIRSIGLSNFMPSHIDALLKTAEIKPAVNQIEYHPGYIQKQTVELCRENNILIEAWSPLGTGKMLSNEKLLSIAKKYKKSVAQLCIRWCLQNGTLPLPKSVTPSRIKENADVFGFEIDQKDMQQIDDMPYFGGSGLDPNRVDF